MGKVVYLDQLLTRILLRNPNAQQDLILLSCFICNKILEISCWTRDQITHNFRTKSYLWHISTISIAAQRSMREDTYTKDKWLEGIQKWSETSLSICKRQEVKVGGDGLWWVESKKMKCVSGYEVIFLDPHQHIRFEGWRREHLCQSQIGALMKVSRGLALSKGTRPRWRKHCPKGWSVDRWDTRPNQVWWW